MRFLKAEWLKNQVTVEKADPEPFRGFRRLWNTPSYELSALQGWRHGVRSRSLGGTRVFDRSVFVPDDRPIGSVSSFCRAALTTVAVPEKPEQHPSCP
jgi:hypothetical protein